MGMAFKQISNAGVAPFWESLARSNKLPQPVFTIQMLRQKDNSKDLKPGGDFTLGFVDPSQYSGPVT